MVAKNIFRAVGLYFTYSYAKDILLWVLTGDGRTREEIDIEDKIVEKVEQLKEVCGEICNTQISTRKPLRPEVGFLEIRKA